MASHTKSASMSTPPSYTSTVSPPSSPYKASPRPTHKARRPSLSNTMSKLKDSLNHTHLIDGLQHKRAHSHSRAHDGPYKGIQISEPKLAGSFDQLAAPRLGPLGSGATVVRTPQEAMALAASKPMAPNVPPSSSSSAPYYRVQASTSAPSRIHVYHPATLAEEAELPPSPKSPALPPLPTSPQSQTAPSLPPHSHNHSRRSAGSSQASGSRIFPPAPPPPTSQLPLTPDVSPSMQNRASLKSQDQQRASRTSSRPKSAAASSSRSRTRSSWSRSVLHLTPDLLEAAPQAPFAPVLMSNLPANMHKIDASRTLVVLETSTSTVKTTLKTLTSQSSFLATYLVELIGSTSSTSRSPTVSERTESMAEEDGDSVYSQRSEFHDSDVDEEDGFNSLFQEHLAVNGIVKPQRPKRRADGTATIHVFLDRPSTPYTHILSYLRASLSSLPYAVRLFPTTRGSFSPSRLEGLLELRDEAAYLGLSDLQKLCDEDLAAAFAASSAALSDRDLAAGPDGEGETGRDSVHSTHTLCEPSADVVDRLTKDSSAHHMPPPLSTHVQTVDMPVIAPHLNQQLSPTSTNYTNSTYSNGSDRARRPRQAFPFDAVPSRDEVANSLHLRATSPTRREFDRVKPLGNYF